MSTSSSTKDTVPGPAGEGAPATTSGEALPAVRHLVSIDDVTNDDMRALFEHADRFAADPRAFADTCPEIGRAHV